MHVLHGRQTPGDGQTHGHNCNGLDVRLEVKAGGLRAAHDRSSAHQKAVGTVGGEETRVGVGGTGGEGGGGEGDAGPAESVQVAGGREGEGVTVG